MLFAWQALGFRRVAKYVAGAGVRQVCKNVGRRNDAFRVAGAVVSRFVMSMLFDV